MENALHRALSAFVLHAATVPLKNGLIEGCDAFLQSLPAEEILSAAAMLNFANPFYLPEIPIEAIAGLAVGSVHLATFIFCARLAAHHAPQPNILVACAPKSASTFIQSALCRVSGLPNVTLNSTADRPGAASVLGIDLREQELDELALIRHGLNGAGYVAQHHVRATPYLCAQLDRFKIRPVVTYRNVFDSLVSLDDMLLAERREARETDAYFSDAMPACYPQMPEEERFRLLAARMAPWYLQFYLSWRKVERAGLVSPFWISYEADFMTDKSRLAFRLSDFLGADRFPPAALELALSDRERGRDARLNQGISGRGVIVPPAVRDMVMRLFEHYADEDDFAPLVGS